MEISGRMPASSQASSELSTASLMVVSSAFDGLSKPSRWRFLVKNSEIENLALPGGHLLGRGAALGAWRLGTEGGAGSSAAGSSGCRSGGAFGTPARVPTRLDGAPFAATPFAAGARGGGVATATSSSCR